MPARLMLYHAAELKDQGKPFDQEASMAKLFATEKGMEARTRRSRSTAATAL